MNFTYPKKERLKSKTTIGLLFSEGKSVSKYPLRLVYRQAEVDAAEKIKMGVSVSKKYFKRAVDRNYFKRVLRETYRLNKHLLLDNIQDTLFFDVFLPDQRQIILRRNQYQNDSVVREISSQVNKTKDSEDKTEFVILR